MWTYGGRFMNARFAAGGLGACTFCGWGAGGAGGGSGCGRARLRLGSWGHARFEAGGLSTHVLRLGGQEAGGAGGTHVLRRRHARFAAGQAMQEKG